MFVLEAVYGYWSSETLNPSSSARLISLSRASALPY